MAVLVGCGVKHSFIIDSIGGAAPLQGSFVGGRGLSPQAPSRSQADSRSLASRYVGVGSWAAGVIASQRVQPSQESAREFSHLKSQKADSSHRAAFHLDVVSALHEPAPQHGRVGAPRRCGVPQTRKLEVDLYKRGRVGSQKVRCCACAPTATAAATTAMQCALDPPGNTVARRPRLCAPHCRQTSPPCRRAAGAAGTRARCCCCRARPRQTAGRSRGRSRPGRERL